jgi:hypothetical protein
VGIPTPQKHSAVLKGLSSRKPLRMPLSQAPEMRKQPLPEFRFFKQEGASSHCIDEEFPTGNREFEPQFFSAIKIGPRNRVRPTFDTLVLIGPFPTLQVFRKATSVVG